MVIETGVPSLIIGTVFLKGWSQPKLLFTFPKHVTYPSLLYLHRSQNSNRVTLSLLVT